jgi:hypothetical protein
LRRPCHALITPEAVIFDTGGNRLPLVQGFDAKSIPRIDCSAFAVGQLFKLMDQTQVRGRRVQVAMADAWARPAVLTLSVKASDDASVDTLVASHYRRIYGDLMDGWSWCWSQRDTRLVAVAWPSVVLKELQAGLERRGCVFASARSLGLMLGEQLRHEPGDCWLVTLARDYFLLMRLQDGVLQGWHVALGVAETASPAAQLPLQLARQSALHGDTCRAVVIIDFDATHDLPALCATLHDAGWSSRVCAAAELSGSWVWRLQQQVRLETAA